MPNTTADERPPHLSVLFQESIKLLQPKSHGRYVDGTLGAGGHAAGILEFSQPDGELLGLDIDGQALEIAAARLSKYGSRAIIKKGSYANLAEYLRKIDWPCTDGIILDLGLSSIQLDSSERGFSFLKDAPLDMRFNKDQKQTAAGIINTWSEKDLTKVMWEFGEEPKSRQIAAAIVDQRPLSSTYQLAAIVIGAYKGKRGKVHPATRTFQALRIAVNEELDTLEKGLEEAIKTLCEGGRLAVISFHSLEDRMVKQLFQRESRDCICPPEQPVCVCGHKASVKLISKKAIIPSQEEVVKNPRARSAKLRVVEKL
jgi:16S rRNA (cytosine1402-N4)-methyltransferase